MNTHMDNARLHAFVDNELDIADAETLLQDISANPDLREAVCDLRRLKSLVNHAYTDVQPPRERNLSWRHGNPWKGVGTAASLLLAVGFLAGWTNRPSATPTNLASAVEVEPPLRAVSLNGVQAPNGPKAILHVSMNDGNRFDEVLSQAQTLLTHYRKLGVEIEVIANGTGLDLLRADASPYTSRIRRMMADYPNLHFVACHQAIERLEASGTKAVLIQRTQVAPSAIEHIVQRLQQGWTYIKV